MACAWGTGVSSADLSLLPPPPIREIDPWTAEVNPRVDALAGLCHTETSLRAALLRNPQTIFDFRRGFRSWPESEDFPPIVIPEVFEVTDAVWRVT